MKLIIGLGNIGARYAHTRHNIGFMVADQLAANLGATWKHEAKFKTDLAETTMPDGTRLLLAKPHTMMNLSGEAAQKIAAFYKIDPADVWAIFDEIDVPFGRLRLRSSGSGGGHQGVNSLIQHLGPSFVRVRVGISLNDRTTEPSEVYVLKPFTPEEQSKLPQLIQATTIIMQAQILLETPEESTFDLIN
jgi:peptidyl-tRNA hydrolase, PTH1 family